MIKKKSISKGDILSKPISYKKITEKRLGVPSGVEYYGKSILHLDIKNEYVDDLGSQLKKTIVHGNITGKTTFINIGVGRGKTTAIYEFIEHLYKNTDHVIIMASPFRSLVQKDYDNITSGDLSLKRNPVPKKDVVNYMEVQEIAEMKRNGLGSAHEAQIEKLACKRIHVISINSLMRNPGDQYYFSSSLMKYYLTNIQRYIRDGLKPTDRHKLEALYKQKKKLESKTKSTGINKTLSKVEADIEKYENRKDNLYSRKAYLFFDELHESVHNFDKRYVYNLYNWSGLIANQYISSATFSESSLEVAIYLSYIFHGFINVLELPREKYPKHKQSRLHLVFTSGNYSKNNKYYGLESIQDLIDKKKYKKFHILSYSKKLIRYLEDQDYYKKLKPNICVSEDDFSSDPANRFDPTKINLGTNFKTGVNIPKGDPLFIILPYNYTSIFRTTSFGIFTDGEPAIIQALARVRSGSDVYVIVPEVDTIIDDEGHTNGFLQKHGLDGKLKYKNELPLPKTEELNAILLAYNKIFDEVNEKFIEYMEQQHKYSFYPDEDFFIQAFGSSHHKKAVIKDVLKKFYSEFGVYFRPKVYHTSHTEFILEEGQRYLCTEFLSCGKKIYPYVLWAALNDQFTNCTLKSIYKYYPPIEKLTIKTSTYVRDFTDFIKKQTEIDLKKLEKKKLTEIIEELTEVTRNVTKGGSNKTVTYTLDGKKLTKSQQKSNKNYWLTIMGTAIYLKSGKIVDLKDVEEFYLSQRVHHNDPSKNSLEAAYGRVKTFVDEFIKEYKGKGYAIQSKDYHKNKPKLKTSLKVKDLKADLIGIIGEEDPLFQKDAFSRFRKKDTLEQVYNAFLNSFIEKSVRPKRKKDQNFYEVKGAKLKKEKKML